MAYGLTYPKEKVKPLDYLVKNIYFIFMNTLVSMVTDLWTIRHPFSVGGFQIGTKTTVVRSDGELMLISPGPLEDDLCKQIESLGEVTKLLAPNAMHHLFLAQAVNRWPKAQVHLARGLKEKRPDLEHTKPIPGDLTGWRLEQQFVEGMPKLNETAFFHKPSQTLVLTDLAFNFPGHPHWLSRLLLRLNGAYGNFGPTRILKSVFLQDPSKAKLSLREIEKWPFEQIVVAHGGNLTHQAKETFRSSYAWLLES
jgi:hypothetical protein